MSLFGPPKPFAHDPYLCTHDAAARIGEAGKTTKLEKVSGEAAQQCTAPSVGATALAQAPEGCEKIHRGLRRTLQDSLSPRAWQRGRLQGEEGTNAHMEARRRPLRTQDDLHPLKAFPLPQLVRPLRHQRLRQRLELCG